MRCSRVQDRLMAYHDGELSASGNRKIEKHLSTCDECTQLLERFVQADQASATAGVPEVSGADDRYWESFTSRALDRVEEEAANRVPVPETQSRPFFRMEFPSLVPAMSIALVVVVSAGVLLKVGRVAPVPEAPLTKAQVTEAGDKNKDDTAYSFRQRSDEGTLVGPELIKRAAPVPSPAQPPAEPQSTVPGRLTGKLASSSIEPVISKEAAAAVPRQEGEAALPESVFPGDAPPASAPPVSAAKAELNLKKTAMADEADIQPDRDVAPHPAAVEPPGEEQVAEPAPVQQQLEDRSEARKAILPEPAEPEKSKAPAAPEPLTDAVPIDNASPGREGSATGSVLVVAGEAVNDALTEKQPTPAIDQIGAVEAAPSSPVLAPALVEKTVESVAVPLPGVEEVPPATATAQISTDDSLKAKNAVEEAERSASRPSLYRVPREQLEHARRLAEVRKYWESEQILKDLISRKPPPPVFEEASLLMVDVLSNQNRIVEAQQFLDEAKLQFPSSNLVQEYRLGAPAPVQ